jgi:hypothetical protein
MKGLKLVFFLIVGCLIAPIVHANIYEWMDESGVRHFTNYAPPDHARIIVKTEEIPYDESADQARMEAERLERLAFAQQRIAEREAELEQREFEANARLAEANRKTAETLRKAEELLNETRYTSSYRRSWITWPSSCYYPNPHDKKRRYHGKKRHGDSQRPPTVKPYKTRQYTKPYFAGQNKNSHGAHTAKSFGTSKQTNALIHRTRSPSRAKFGTPGSRSYHPSRYRRNASSGLKITFGRQ